MFLTVTPKVALRWYLQFGCRLMRLSLGIWINDEENIAYRTQVHVESDQRYRNVRTSSTDACGIGGATSNWDLIILNSELCHWVVYMEWTAVLVSHKVSNLKVSKNFSTRNNNASVSRVHSSLPPLLCNFHDFEGLVYKDCRVFSKWQQTQYATCIAACLLVSHERNLCKS